MVNKGVEKINRNDIILCLKKKDTYQKKMFKKIKIFFDILTFYSRLLMANRKQTLTMDVSVISKT